MRRRSQLIEGVVVGQEVELGTDLAARIAERVFRLDGIIGIHRTRNFRPDPLVRRDSPR